MKTPGLATRAAQAEGYRVILADPPWPWTAWSAKGMDRSPEMSDEEDGAPRHYRTIPLAQLATLPVGNWAAKDAVLFLWVPDFQLPAAFELARAWGGFEFRTVAFYWVKLNKPVTVMGGMERPHRIDHPESKPIFPIGLGTWTRSNAEQCLLFGRGRGVPVAAHDVPKLVLAPRGDHSAKPEAVASRIERLTGTRGPYLELFARARRPGWTAWGDQVPPESEAGPEPGAARTWISYSCSNCRQSYQSDAAPEANCCPECGDANGQVREGEAPDWRYAAGYQIAPGSIQLADGTTLYRTQEEALKTAIIHRKRYRATPSVFRSMGGERGRWERVAEPEEAGPPDAHPEASGPG